MKLYKFGLPIVALALLASCSDDKFDGPKEETADALYLSLQIKPVTGTRTATGSTGEEVGKTGENEISSAMVILVDENFKVKTSATLSPTKIGSTNNYNATGEVDRSKVTDLVDATLKVFVVCNPPSGFNPQPDADIQKVLYAATNDATYNTFVAKYSTAENFLMTNADQEKWEITLTAADLAPGAHLQDNPFPMGPIKVQRAVARFDIYTQKGTDGTQQVSVADEDNPLNFTVALADEEGDATISVTLTEAALLNVSKSFNVFKTLAEAKSTSYANTDWKFFLDEYNSTATAFNYSRVVNDPESSNKVNFISANAETPADLSQIGTYFYNNAFKDNEGVSVQEDPESFTFKTLNGLENSTQKPTNSEIEEIWTGYGIFDYCSANTIHNPADQKKVISTGVLFKAQMTGSAFDDAEGGVYVFNGKIYGEFGDLKSYYTAQETSNNNADFTYLKRAIEAAMDAYNVAQNNTTVETKVKFTDASATELALKKYLVAQKFTVYEPGEDGNYYCYYYYWNRHNDNNAPATMGVMEFGVVRNNIYKLRVTDINQLGHPSKSEDDPTPNKPDDPDEDNDFYMSVEVQVLPWVVRVNDIQF
ncbi:MAG: Mfa1 fimbrilin C-terminal domain-containing protein [Muribaculaceae bacterium]|nr:Mfa1 fimbrilin C-terminal domain-containing protein [Muribaculaceae bacterium]